MGAITGSSAIEHVDHDGRALIVRFTTGREYRYPTAGPEHVDAFHAAESAGRYFNREIRPYHDHEVEQRGAAASYIRAVG
jgi:hypothetical protein